MCFAKSERLDPGFQRAVFGLNPGLAEQPDPGLLQPDHSVMKPVNSPRELEEPDRRSDPGHFWESGGFQPALQARDEYRNNRCC